MSKLNTVLVYDEGDTTFSKHAEQVMLGYPTASTLFTTSRSSGIGAIVITHQPSKVITSLRSEAYTKIIFNLSDAEDARYMAQACSLTKEEAVMISKLPNYHAIVSIRRCHKPFIIKAFNKADQLRKNPIVIKDKTRDKIAELQSYVIPRKKNETVTTADRVQEPAHHYFNLNEIKLLEHTFAEPFLNTTERYKALSMSPLKGNKTTQALLDNNLVTKVTLKTRKGRGGVSTFLELTKQGLEKLGRPKHPYTGKGSLKHNYFAHKVAEKHRAAGHEVRQEYLNCDVAVKNGNDLNAIEICIHDSNIIENITRNQENGFIKTILVFENQQAMKKASIQSNENVEIKLIDDYLE